jgi:two-component system C4-dicarboxylate transport sensor histidine kinase DctB
VVPLLLSRDPTMIAALNSQDYSTTSQRLISYVEEIGAASILLIDLEGRAVAASNREQLGSTHRNQPYMVEALRSLDTVFTTTQLETGGYEFSFSRQVRNGNAPLGVIEVKVDLAKFEQRWRGASEAVVVTNSEGIVILSTEPRWRGVPKTDALLELSAPSAIARAIEATGNWAPYVDPAFFTADAVMELEARIPFRGWRLTTYTSYQSVRERVNGVLALEIMAFAILLATAFYFLSRRAVNRSILFQRESAELRRLNERLSREIAERERVQETLKEAEQSLAQSSKLAALGEMSAAVSHELNQPLAAMKTYLAGAKLLLQRKRPEEALSSFQRIDDLIERMGAITRQLKSYARKGGDAFEPVDVRAAINGALTMMEPQIKAQRVKLTRTTPERPVMVKADRLRLEQVIINLVRNALDAMKGAEVKELDILLTMGDTARLAVRDTGAGIEDLGTLFEPFYTTKKPGEGVGLGLAISSGIISDLGGRLSARNSPDGGAVFEIALPMLKSDAVQAAE